MFIRIGNRGNDNLFKYHGFFCIGFVTRRVLNVSNACVPSMQVTSCMLYESMLNGNNWIFVDVSS